MLKRIALYNFRNYSKGQVSFGPGVNWMVGENGQGKTNLLEAIYLVSTGRSFRTTQLSHLIQKEERSFRLEAEIEKDGVSHQVILSLSPHEKKLQIEGTCYSQLTPLIGLLPHILYAPEDTSLIIGPPSNRRRFLNLHLAQMNPLYLHHLARYHHAMEQRNQLFKNGSIEAIEPWEEIMAYSGSYLTTERKHFIEALQTPLAEVMGTLSQRKDLLRIELRPSLWSKEPAELMEIWKKNREKELLFGHTISGPHRDEVDFFIGNLPAKSFASEGQKHSIIAALRICQWRHLRATTGYVPLMSIDDFGAHLDDQRQRLFQKQIEVGQLFLTSPRRHPDLFPQARHILVDSGEVLEESSP